MRRCCQREQEGVEASAVEDRFRRGGGPSTGAETSAGERENPAPLRSCCSSAEQAH